MANDFPVNQKGNQSGRKRQNTASVKNKKRRGNKDFYGRGRSDGKEKRNWSNARNRPNQGVCQQNKDGCDCGKINDHTKQVRFRVFGQNLNKMSND